MGALNPYEWIDHLPICPSNLTLGHHQIVSTLTMIQVWLHGFAHVFVHIILCYSVSFKQFKATQIEYLAVKERKSAVQTAQNSSASSTSCGRGQAPSCRSSFSMPGETGEAEAPAAIWWSYHKERLAHVSTFRPKRFLGATFNQIVQPCLSINFRLLADQLRKETRGIDRGEVGILNWGFCH